MDRFSSRQLAKAMGISHELARQLLNLRGAPDPERFTNPETYFKRLAKLGFRAGHTHPVIEKYAVGRKKTAQPPSLSPEEEMLDADDLESSRAPVPAPRRVGSSQDVDMDDLQQSAQTLRGVVQALGTTLEGMLRDGDVGSTIPILDKFKGLQAEFRQSAQRLEELRAERLLVLPRQDVYAAAGRFFQAVRAFGDSLTTELLDNGALPAWISAAGGVFPDSRQAIETVRGLIKAFAAERFNQMADALGNLACPLEDTRPELRADCCVEMAAELERVAKSLRERAMDANAAP